MKRLILLLLTSLFACSHERPLTDHQHDHEHTLIAHEHNLTDHEHELADHTHEPVEYPTATLILEEPGIRVSERQPIGIGKLSYDGQQWILVVFSQPPIGLTVTDVPDPDGRPTIPISSVCGKAVTEDIDVLYRGNGASRIGGIAVKLKWHSGARCCATRAQSGRRRGTFITRVNHMNIRNYHYALVHIPCEF